MASFHVFTFMLLCDVLVRYRQYVSGNSTVPIATLTPAFSMSPDVVRQWLHFVLENAKNDTSLDNIPVDPFTIVVESDGFAVPTFYCNFTQGSVIGLNHLTRPDECADLPDNMLECKIPLKDLSMQLKAQTIGDIFIPTEHPIVTTTMLTDTLLMYHVEKIIQDGHLTDLKVRYAVFDDRPKMETVIVGTLSLSEERESTFRHKLHDEVYARFHNETFVKFINTISGYQNISFNPDGYSGLSGSNETIKGRYSGDL